MTYRARCVTALGLVLRYSPIRFDTEPTSTMFDQASAATGSREFVPWSVYRGGYSKARPWSWSLGENWVEMPDGPFTRHIQERSAMWRKP